MKARTLIIPCLLLTACSGAAGAPGVTLDAPPSTSTPTASPSATTKKATTPAKPLTEKQKILAAYRSYYAARDRAGKSLTVNVARTMSPYAAGPAYRATVDGMAADRRKGIVYYGTAVSRPTIARIEAKSTRAIIRDCKDTSQAGTMKASTRQQMTTGLAEDSFLVELRKISRVWKVYRISVVEPAGAYCS